MGKDSLRLLADLTNANGAPGHESAVREIIRREMAGLAEISQDKLGSIVCRKQGTADAPRVMIPGHMDEIGFMVRTITPEGFLRFLPLGGWWAPTVLAQRVIVQTSKGDVIGIVGAKPSHLLSDDERKRVLPIKEMFIDVGAKNQKDAEKRLGVRPGDPVVPCSEFAQMADKKLVIGKALDDRAGCAMFIELVQRLQKIKHPNTVYAVGTVQEEVGLRGARTAVDLIRPDVAIVSEVGVIADAPGVSADDRIGVIGGGPQICLHDSGMIPNLRLRDLVVSVAEENRIPYQFYVLEGGRTDGEPIQIHAEGVPVIYIGVPTRYIHSHTGMMHLDDYEHTVKLLTKVVQRLDRATVEGLSK